MSAVMSGAGAIADWFGLPDGAAGAIEMPPVTTTQLVKYAGASGDYNRIHYDQPWALEAGLGGVVAHGLLTMGFMASALGRGLAPRDRVEFLSARFTALVRPGDVVRIEVRIGPHAAALAAAGDGHEGLPARAPGRRIDGALEARVGGTLVATGTATLLRPD